MHLKRISHLLSASFLFIAFAAISINAQNGYARDPNQQVDQDYTKKIAEYTTEKFFKRRLSRQVTADGNRVDKVADQIRQPVMAATNCRRADDDGFLPGIVM